METQTEAKMNYKLYHNGNLVFTHRELDLCIDKYNFYADCLLPCESLILKSWSGDVVSSINTFKIG